ncbi:DUF4396 domain-containing protein (plasmid) [Clavibacter phaseoli]|jgi:hypothetical protein|nr:DUF4396 domain-containing protein [Clavibacter phaseoli]UKF38464.1 DUF4396 domain-containing protein [Clavibacter phaseoli]
MNDDMTNMTSMSPAFPVWLTPLSWFFVALGVISAVILAYNIFGRRWYQRNRAMNVVWPVAGLFLGPVAIWAFNRWGRSGDAAAPSSQTRHSHELNGQTIAGSTPGGAAATVGHFIGVPLVVASGATIAGTNLWVMIIVIALLAIGMLFVFEYFFASEASSLAVKRKAGVALLSAALTVVAFDVGMGGWMLLMHFGNFMPAPSDVRFFFLMQLGLVFGFLTAYPMVRQLLRRRITAAA